MLSKHRCIVEKSFARSWRLQKGIRLPDAALVHDAAASLPRSFTGLAMSSGHPERSCDTPACSMKLITRLTSFPKT